MTAEPLVEQATIVGGLWVDRWWRRRKARKHAEALARQTVAAMVTAARPVGEVLLNAFRQLVPVVNDAAKSIDEFSEAFRTVPPVTGTPDSDTQSERTM